MGVLDLVTFPSSLWGTALAVFLGTIVVLFLKSWWDTTHPPKPPIDLDFVGEITSEELQKYDGRDPFLPLLFSVRGRVFDVTKGRDFYGPGGGYAVFAGKEVARALGLMSLKADDCTDVLEDLTPRQLEVLQDWEKKFEEKYKVAGSIVPMKELTPEELMQHDGSDPSKPIYLAICGTVYDVTRGRQFYGPDGIYPFAGRECARAFALISTDTKDCHDNLEGLDKMELDNLRSWQEKFYFKYQIIGKTVKKLELEQNCKQKASEPVA